MTTPMRLRKPPSREAMELEALETELLLTAVKQRYGYDFTGYSKPSLKRRIRRAVLTEGLVSISGLQERLLHDEDSLSRFIATVSVPVTAMFRDPAFYRSLQEHVVPLLRTYPHVRVWVAGCATGEEAYSLAILLAEQGLYDRCRIYATDISGEVLRRASDGRVSLELMRAYTQNYLKAGGTQDFSSYYRVQGPTAVLDPSLRRNMVFSQHNLVADAAFNEFQLILCRNVAIYFGQELRDRVHSLLHESLCRFGILAVGMGENLRFTSVEQHYRPIDAVRRIYRRTS